MLASSPVVVTLPAVDLKRAKNFYTKTLGLAPVDIGDLGENAALFTAGNGTQIFIYPREATKAEHTAATFVVQDIESTVSGLARDGVVFEQYDFDQIKTDARGIATMGETKGAWFKDTEGNIIALMTNDVGL
jgi:predicted enzyme related to lactoylglutathione lyase